LGVLYDGGVVKEIEEKGEIGGKNCKKTLE
jgi:hypothetical protein